MIDRKQVADVLMTCRRALRRHHSKRSLVGDTRLADRVGAVCKELAATRVAKSADASFLREFLLDIRKEACSQGKATEWWKALRIVDEWHKNG